MAKKTGLASFSQEVKPAPAALTRQRGKADIITVPARFRHEAWQRTHQLALEEGTSIQKLLMLGLDMIFESRGLPKISE